MTFLVLVLRLEPVTTEDVDAADVVVVALFLIAPLLSATDLNPIEFKRANRFGFSTFLL